MSAIRQNRINEEVRKVLSEIIREMKDPRISPMTTLTSCEVTRDLKYAKIRVSVYSENEAERKETVDTLNRASGYLISELGNRIRLRALPALKFSLDDSIAYSIHISQIIDSLHAQKGGEEVKKEEEE